MPRLARARPRGRPDPRWGLALGLVLASPAAARAQAPAAHPDVAPALGAGDPGRPLEATAPLWREVRRPGSIRAAALVRQALDRLADADRAALLDRRSAFSVAYLEAARARLDRATELAPDDPVAAFLLAAVTRRLADERGSAPLRADALRGFLRVRAIDPTYEASSVAAALAALHTRAHRFADARDEHRRALDAALFPETRWTETANLAESAMLAGDLPAAVALYRRALALAERYGADATLGPRRVWVGVLSLWGLAVALDRLGEHDAALERAGEALSLGPDLAALEVLRTDSVFFEPAEEIYWYEALGWEAVARAAATPAEAAEAREQARRRWRRYLVRGGDDARWAELVRDHLARLADPDRR